MRKRKHKKRVHKRGCIHSIAPINDVTTWNGQLFDPIVRKKVKVGDSVRVIMNERMPIYLTITKELGKQYLMGVIDDPYRGRCGYSCNECSKRFDEKDLINIYTCEGIGCFRGNYHCHKSCKPKSNKCPLGCQLERYKYGDGNKIIFRRSAISEIPNWSDNTYSFVDKYGLENGYLFTGVR